MSKHIKLDDAIHNINLEVTGRKEYTGDMKANLFFALDDLPTIDIVRCGECKWFDSKGHCMRLTAEYGTYEDVRTDDFCAYGEREGE